MGDSNMGYQYLGSSSFHYCYYNNVHHHRQTHLWAGAERISERIQRDSSIPGRDTELCSSLIRSHKSLKRLRTGKIPDSSLLSPGILPPLPIHGSILIWHKDWGVRWSHHLWLALASVVPIPVFPVAAQSLPDLWQTRHIQIWLPDNNGFPANAALSKEESLCYWYALGIKILKIINYWELLWI